MAQTTFVLQLQCMFKCLLRYVTNNKYLSHVEKSGILKLTVGVQLKFYCSVANDSGMCGKCIQLLSRHCEFVASGFHVIFAVGYNSVCSVGNMVKYSGLLIHNINAFKVPV
jgi:hypothetical protein